MHAETMADWRELSLLSGFALDADAITVEFADGRRQVIRIEEHRDGAIRLWSSVARPYVVRTLATPLLDAWYRNRLSEFVGFAIDRRGRMVGELWVPPGPTTATEWTFYVNCLAQACDRYEYLLTGRDEG